MTIQTRICYDCSKKLGDKEGLDLVYKLDDKEIRVAKCQECFDKKKGINYKECEVYSRVCGYIRPTRQWHEGKQEEFKDRVDYKI